jgi:DNA-binding winged helix-turn-helix (wHTH) protein/tetratricopeptide (TPR) repeat protein
MTSDIVFGPFRIQAVSGRLLRGERPVPLGPRAFELLHYLARRPGHLITKGELLASLWPGTHVSGEALRVCVREVRKALGDDAKSPRYIETAHRRGYRFVGISGAAGNPAACDVRQAAIHDPGPLGDTSAAGRIVGREKEQARLEACLLDASRGLRRIVFLSGESGIGKTATVEAFLAGASARPGLMIARGGCLEQYGSGEAYLPLFDALGRLGRGPSRQWLASLLRRYAPTWLAHLPALVKNEDRARLQRETLGASTGRMLREIAEAIEVLTRDTTLILFLEDLHWSDYSTLDLISFLARRQEPARLMLVGTYRDLEVRLSRHPVRAVQQELLARGLCERIRLGLLSRESVQTYLENRFPDLREADGISAAIHRRTDGNPLFLVNLVSYLVTRGLLGPSAAGGGLDVMRREIEQVIPDGLRQLIQKQIDRLTPEERAVLEAASAASIEFSAVAVAAALDKDVPQVERVCERLAGRGEFLRPAGVRRMPDGTLSARFSFIHSLYQHVLYDTTQPSHRLRLHHRIAERGVSIFGERAGEIAAELAMHYEQSRDYVNAVMHLRAAAANACRRRAWREALDHLSKAKEHIARLPVRRRPPFRMLLLEQRGMARRSMGDMQGAAGDFRTLTVCARRHGRAKIEARGLLLLASARSWSHGRASLAAARRAVSLSGRLGDRFAQAQVRSMGGYWDLTLRGWTDAGERACARTIALARRAGNTSVLSQHLVRHALFRCLQGRYADASRIAREGLDLAVSENEAFDHLLGLFFLGWALLHSGRWAEAGSAIDEGARTASENENQPWRDLFLLMRAWLHQEAFDSRGGRSLCEPALARDRVAGFSVGRIMALTLLGRLALGLGESGEARRRFEEVLRLCRRGPVVMGWYWETQSRLGLAESWLESGEFERARDQAQRVFRVAALSGEATLMSLAYAVSAQASLAAGAVEKARRKVGEALAIAGSQDVPLAEWRVADVAAREALSRGADAGPHRERCAAVLRSLALSLNGGGDLRQTFLSHPRVQALLSGDAPSGSAASSA